MRVKHKCPKCQSRDLNVLSVRTTHLPDRSEVVVRHGLCDGCGIWRDSQDQPEAAATN